MNLGLFPEILAMAVRALTANRLRSLLALVGVVIGVATVIGMASLINGFQRSVEDSIRSMGTNTIYIHRIRPGLNMGPDIPDSLKQRKAFTIGDGEAILAHCPSVRAICPMKFDYNNLRLEYRGKFTRGTQVYGTDDNYLAVHGYDLARGRYFTPEEVERRGNIVVLGPTASEALFKNRNPVGETVRIAEIPFTVIGEYTPKGKLLGEDLDASAAIPYTTMDKYFPAPPDAPPWVPRRGELFLHAIAASPQLNDQAQREIIDVLRVRRHLPSNKPNDFAVFTDEAIMSIWQMITGGIVAVMILVSGVSLVVGGIGVMNIMLVAVTERTREIGVRKALGAPRRAILTQFLAEAVLLTAGGGTLGVLVGAGISGLVHALSPLPTFVSPWSVITGLLFSAAVGVFFGLYPAMRASALDPVDSLRYE